MGANSFITACKNRQKSIIKVFLNSKKIDINERDDMGRTGLFYSCGEGDREIVKLLIEAGADVNLGDNNSITKEMIWEEQVFFTAVGRETEKL